MRYTSLTHEARRLPASGTVGPCEAGGAGARLLGKLARVRVGVARASLLGPLQGRLGQPFLGDQCQTLGQMLRVAANRAQQLAWQRAARPISRSAGGAGLPAWALRGGHAGGSVGAHLTYGVADAPGGRCWPVIAVMSPPRRACLPAISLALSLIALRRPSGLGLLLNGKPPGRCARSRRSESEAPCEGTYTGR